MNVLDLFSGLGGWSSAFKEAGDDIVSLDIEKKFNPTYCIDIMQVKDLKDLEINGKFDIVLASPPCNCFSVASCYRHWSNGKPKDEATLKAIEIVKHTQQLISDYNPKWYIIENPRGMLRKVIGKPTYEIWQCMYGRKIAKPTDLWGSLPSNFQPLKCKNNSPNHSASPRGSDSGTQGIHHLSRKEDEKGKGHSASERAKIPYGLSKAIRDSIIVEDKTI